MLQRTLPAGFISPCLPSKTDKLPSGRQWLHEIKHDGFRVIARNFGWQSRAVMPFPSSEVVRLKDVLPVGAISGPHQQAVVAAY
jgi:hypothetical protein